MPLRDLLKSRFNTALNALPRGTWKILITDSHSQALLDQVYSNFEILQQNVTSVEPLHSPRQPMSVDAIYLLTPTAQNVERIIADFQGRRTYKSAYLFFVDGIDDHLAQRLTSMLPGDVLKAFTELYCNFWAVEDRIFSLKTPSSFFTMFGNLGGAISADLSMEAFEDDVKVVGRSVLNILATLNESPYIRYYNPSYHPPLGPLSPQGQGGSALAADRERALGGPAGPTSLRTRMGVGNARTGQVGAPGAEHLCRKLAGQVQSDLDDYIAANPEFPAQNGRPRATLLIVDRSMDPCAPLVHDFWYQAMVNDLLPIKDGRHYKYKYTNTVGGTEDKEAHLDDSDEVWCSVRHLHMKDAIDHLMTSFGKFVQEHAGFSGGGGQANVNDLKDMLASLPQFQKEREQYSLHLDMAQECMSIFEKKHLNVAANVEQCSATGYNSDGKTPKTLVEEMVPLLDDRMLTPVDKVRIIALYILFREGVADEDRRRLFQHARLALTEQDSINNLVYLGQKVIKDGKDRSSKGRIKQKYTQVEGEYELSRFKPVLQMIIEDNNYNRLDQGQFPFIKDTPPELAAMPRTQLQPQNLQPSSSLRSARPTWHKAPSARMTNTEGKQRVIVFVAGGMTYSEMRLAYTVGQTLGKEIYIGSSHITTPEEFVRDLRSLGRGGIGSNPPRPIAYHPQAPDRANRAPGQPTTYQAILDRRHWAPPVGPPPLGAPPGAPGGQGAVPGQQGQRPPARSAGSALGSQSNVVDLSGKFGGMGIGSIGKKGKDAGGAGGDAEGKKKGLFKMKW